MDVTGRKGEKYKHLVERNCNQRRKYPNETNRVKQNQYRLQLYNEKKNLIKSKLQKNNGKKSRKI